MGDLFRSEPMSLCQLFVPLEAAYATVAELGESGCMQFKDLNAGLQSQQRSYVSEVLRCDKLQNILSYIRQQVKNAKLAVPSSRSAVADAEEAEMQLPAAPNARQINVLEFQLEQTERELREGAGDVSEIEQNFVEAHEHKSLLERADKFFLKAQIAGIVEQPNYLDYVTGVMPLEHYHSFELMLWRVSRGNIFLKRSELRVYKTSRNWAKPVPEPSKVAFVAIFQGEQLKQRVLKICAGYHANLYVCPLEAAQRAELLDTIKVQMADMQLVLSQTDDHRSRVLHAAAQQLNSWRTQLVKIQAIYHTLNKFIFDFAGSKCLVGEGWTPASEFEHVKCALESGTRKSNCALPTILQVVQPQEAVVPPTFIRTNRFTRGFQQLIDAYGIASYGEANPTLFTLITFPFLFACMFGDVGHGLILALFAAWLVYKERQLANVNAEIFRIFFGGRYIILLMGLFSVYTGFIYNDVFAVSMNLFGTGWRVPRNASMILGHAELTLDPKYALESVYPMGLDPVWGLAGNKIIFQNTYKMKLSIILGVAHMLVGLCVSCHNLQHSKRHLHILFDFVPQLLFLLLLFGYLVFMLFYKWVKYTAQTEQLTRSPGCAPSILVHFINMVLMRKTPAPAGCEAQLYEGQFEVQTILLVLALLCVPWMLLAKPLYHHRQLRRSTSTEHAIPTSEVFIYQTIHTIEFVLSTVSHTASYLRLWALSLAHAQLSEVLWDRLFRMAFIFPIGFGNTLLIFVLFVPWAFLTLSILVVIEGLSAFLHTLRLHWVEFMSKFYKGEGYLYEPFAFKILLQTPVN